MANSPLKNVRAKERDSTNWSKCIDSLSKGLIYILIIEIHWNRSILRDVRGQNILPVINVIKWGSTINHPNQESGSTIDVFLYFVVQA